MKGINSKEARQYAVQELLRTKLNGIVKKSDIQPRTLRAFGELLGDSQTVSFNYKESAKILAGEALLRDNRIFIGTHLAFGIAKVPMLASGSGGATVLAPGNMEVISYPHPDMFASSTVPVTSFGGNSGSASTATELQAIRMFFNGKVTLKTDNKIRLEEFPMSRFSILTQYGAYFQRQLEYVDMFSAWMFDGSQENTALIQFMSGKYDGIAGNPTTHRNYGVSEFEGFEIVCDAIKLPQIKAALAM